MTPQKIPTEKPTPEEILMAVIRMTSLIPHSPLDDDGRKLVAMELSQIVTSKAYLDRMVHAAISRLTEWQGIAGLQQAYAHESEQAYFTEQSERTQQEIAEWKRQAKELPQDEQRENQALTEAADASVKTLA